MPHTDQVQGPHVHAAAFCLLNARRSRLGGEWLTPRELALPLALGLSLLLELLLLAQELLALAGGPINLARRYALRPDDKRKDASHGQGQEQGLEGRGESGRRHFLLWRMAFLAGSS
jgi:hypothetical protein